MKRTGKAYWRSLNELSNTPEFRQWLEREFPEQASEMLDARSRRTVLKLMAASFGLAGLTACRRPVEKILPAYRGSENTIPGIPVNYASTFTLGGFGQGVLVETNDGRPTKIEGNPDHPASLGAAHAYAQASVLNLYDPNRVRAPQESGRETTWERFDTTANELAGTLATNGGGALRILSGAVNSPSLDSLRAKFLARFPNAKWVEYEPVNLDNVIAGAKLAFGQPLLPVYRFEQADVVVSLDSDFLGVDAQSVASIRGFTSRRKITTPSDQMNRLYAVESSFTITGAAADHRLRIRPSEVQALAKELAEAVGGLGSGLNVLNNGAGGDTRQAAARFDQ